MHLRKKYISIHALLAESDDTQLQQAITAEQFLSTLSLRRATSDVCGMGWGFVHFYPRSPCGERPPAVIKNRTAFSVFLSTLSLRRATIDSSRAASFQHHFYPRSPCGERPKHPTNPKNRKRNFYPRSPCGERQKFGFCDLEPIRFLSTLSLRRATIA